MDFEKKEMIKLRTLGFFLLWLIFVLIVLPVNILDFMDLYKGGVTEFFPWVRGGRLASHRSWVGVDIIIVGLFPSIFGLQGVPYLVVMVLCEMVFVAIYVKIYQWVNKKRDEKGN